MDEQESGNLYVNLQEVTKSNMVMSVTKLLATQLMQNPYMTVETFLVGLSDQDLYTFINEEDETKFYEDYILISEMLAAAEGCPPISDKEQVGKRIQQLIVFLTLESLARKGLCKIYRENMSFDEDMMDAKLAERI